MPLLDILSELNEIWDDPAWIMFGLTVGLGLLGLGLLLLYPFGRD
jgi:hypothetical protein